LRIATKIQGCKAQTTATDVDHKVKTYEKHICL
ncbi:hypothetical protein T07_974, partial [Trichinella nelsoni]